jgi:hypothetical protein
MTITLFTGCVALPAVWDVKETPGFHRSNLSKDDVTYDSTIRAFRWKDKKSNSRESEVLRNENGEKIQNEETVNRFFDAKNSIEVGAGTKYSAYGLSAIYTPIVIVEQVFGAIFYFPIRAIMENIEQKENKDIERAYISGRQYFDAGEIDKALSEWGYVKPTFQPIPIYFSDINYWRGRAFEKIGKYEDACNAYLVFLNYSERSIPKYFTVTYPNDPTWDQKAGEAEKALIKLCLGINTALN